MNHRQQALLVGMIGTSLQQGAPLSTILRTIAEGQARRQQQQARWLLDKQLLPQVIAANTKAERKAARRLADQQHTLYQQFNRRHATT